MKLSNKILIGFFGFVFIYLTAVFAEIRLKGTLNILTDDNSIAETVDLSGITAIVIQDIDQYVNVRASDKPRLEVRSLTGDLLKNFKHKIVGDTLILSQLLSTEATAVKVTIFAPAKGFKSLIVDNAQVSVSELNQDVLFLSQTKGNIWMSYCDISKIDIEASDKSYLQIEISELDSLSARMDFAELYVPSPVKFLSGSMENASSLRMTTAREIQFKKDESSRFILY